MKRPLFGFRATLALLLFAAVAGVGGVFWWKYTEKEREIGRLRQAIEHLTASYPIARLVVTGQEQAPPAAATTGGAPTATAAATTTPTTHVRLWLVDDDGRRLDEAHETSLAGRRVYFEALLIVFDDPLVESGDRRAMAFPTRLFTEAVSPSEGYPLNPLDDRGVPQLYDRVQPPAGGLSLREYRDVLRRFWELANAPDEAAEYGIQVVQGQAVFTEYEVGRFYSIFVEADGGLTIRPELHWLE